MWAIKSKHKLTRDGCSQGYKHHGGDWVLQANGAAKVTGQVTNHSSQKTDDHYGNNETRPPVPVFRGRDAGKQNLPEHSQEVHDIVKTRWQTFFSPLILILISWDKDRMTKRKKEKERKAEWR